MIFSLFCRENRKGTKVWDFFLSAAKHRNATVSEEWFRWSPSIIRHYHNLLFDLQNFDGSHVEAAEECEARIPNFQSLIPWIRNGEQSIGRVSTLPRLWMLNGEQALHRTTSVCPLRVRRHFPQIISQIQRVWSSEHERIDSSEGENTPSQHDLCFPSSTYSLGVPLKSHAFANSTISLYCHKMQREWEESKEKQQLVSYMNITHSHHSYRVRMSLQCVHTFYLCDVPHFHGIIKPTRNDEHSILGKLTAAHLKRLMRFFELSDFWMSNLGIMVFDYKSFFTCKTRFHIAKWSCFECSHFLKEEKIFILQITCHYRPLRKISSFFQLC